VVGRSCRVSSARAILISSSSSPCNRYKCPPSSRHSQDRVTDRNPRQPLDLASEDVRNGSSPLLNQPEPDRAQHERGHAYRQAYTEVLAESDQDTRWPRTTPRRRARHGMKQRPKNLAIRSSEESERPEWPPTTTRHRRSPSRDRFVFTWTRSHSALRSGRMRATKLGFPRRSSSRPVIRSYSSGERGTILS
jgi:hypothetical protein